MTRWWIGLVFASLFFSGCKSEEEAPPPPFTLKGHLADIDTKSKFFKRLEVIEVLPAPEQEKTLRTVGQMIALANPSGELEGAKISWVQLDPKLSKGVGLSLVGGVGQAYGVTTVPITYLSQIHSGEKVKVARYGLRRSAVGGSVISIQATGAEPELAQVVFSIRQGEDWYPGTNCEVEFPLVKSLPVRITKNSLLSEGLQEFVFKEVAPGEFEIKPLAVVGETAEDAFVVGDLKAGDHLIGRGAILLKPLVRDVPNKGERDVYP